MKSLIYVIWLIILTGVVSAVDYSLIDKKGLNVDAVNNGCSYNSEGFYTCWDNDYITLPSNVFGTYTGNNKIVSWAIWVRFNTTSLIMSNSSYGYFMNDNTSSSNLFCRFYWFANVKYRTCTIGGTSIGNLGNNVSNSPDVWHLYVISLNATHACQWFDNVSDGCDALTFKGINSSSSTLRLANNNGLTRDMDGDIGRIDFWNTTLIASDVSALWGSNSTTVQLAYQISRYDFDNNSCSCIASANWNIVDHCNMVNTVCNVAIVNITATGWLNISGTSILNATKIIWVPRDAEEAFRMRWLSPSKIRWT